MFYDSKLMDKYSAGHIKVNFDGCATKLRKISCKTFHRKPILLNFVDLSTTFSSMLYFSDLLMWDNFTVFIYSYSFSVFPSSFIFSSC